MLIMTNIQNDEDPLWVLHVNSPTFINCVATTEVSVQNPKESKEGTSFLWEKAAGTKNYDYQKTGEFLNLSVGSKR